MQSRLMFAIARIAVRMDLNLNWLDPIRAWQRGEPLRLRRRVA